MQRGEGVNLACLDCRGILERVKRRFVGEGSGFSIPSNQMWTIEDCSVGAWLSHRFQDVLEISVGAGIDGGMEEN